MSSHTDIVARDAKIARLEAVLEYQQQKITDLEVEKRLFVAKPKDPAPQPATGSPDPALQAEISRLRSEIAAKDAAIAVKDEIIATRIRSEKDLVTTITTLKGALTAIKAQAIGALEEDQPSKEVTPKISVTDTDKHSKGTSISPPKDVKGDGQTKTASPGLTPAKGPPPTSLIHPQPNYAQIVHTPKPLPQKAYVPARYAKAASSATKAAEQHIPSQPWKEIRSVRHERVSQYGNQQGQKMQGQRVQGGQPKGKEPAKGLTSKISSKYMHCPLTSKPAGAAVVQGTTSANTEKLAWPDPRTVTKVTDPPSRESQVGIAVAIPKVQIGQKVSSEKDSKDPSKPRGQAAPLIPESKAAEVLDAEDELTESDIEVYEHYGLPVPPRRGAPKPATKDVAGPASSDPQSTSKDVMTGPRAHHSSNPFGVASTWSFSSPTKEPETKKLESYDSDMNRAAVESNKPIPKDQKGKTAGVRLTPCQQTGKLVPFLSTNDTQGTTGAQRVSVAQPGPTPGSSYGQVANDQKENPHLLPADRPKVGFPAVSDTIPLSNFDPRESGLANASANLKKRLGDEEQPDTSLSLKRLRIT